MGRWGTRCRAPRGTGIFTFDLGAHSEILDHFMANRDAVVAQHRIEQIYVQSIVRDMAFGLQIGC